MRKSRIVIGLTFTALALLGTALPASAKSVVGVEVPPVPKPAHIQALVLSLVPATPTVTPPDIDPQNPELPNLPYVAVPPGLQPAMGVLSPTTVVSCQAAYLGPLVGIVAVTAVFDAAGIEPPIKPSFLNPLFQVATTACVAAPFPKYTACGPDTDISNRINNLPALPAAGPVSVDPFSLLPEPFASLVVVLASIEGDVSHYLYQGKLKPKVSNNLAKQLTCTSV
jgi:hypothetical protein